MLLYGCETWILTPTCTIMTKLEKFQCEIGRQILCLSKHHADLAPLISLRLPSMKARILIRKLNFLAKLLSSTEDTLSTRTFHTFVAENVYDISLVQQCLWLEQSLHIDSVSQQCLANPDSATSLVKSAQNVLRQDWANIIRLAKSHVSLKHIASCDDVASSVLVLYMGFCPRQRSSWHQTLSMSLQVSMSSAIQ